MNVTDQPLAAPGLDSYRYPGCFGWVMIGATSDDEALAEARRSISTGWVIKSLLQKWDGAHYAPVAPPAFTYFINLDERGEFYADVRDEHGETVWEIRGFDIFDDGFMRHKHDLDGLRSYLVGLKAIPDDATLGVEAPDD